MDDGRGSDSFIFDKPQVEDHRSFKPPTTYEEMINPQQFGNKLQLPAPTQRATRELMGDHDQIPRGDDALLTTIEKSGAMEAGLSPDQIKFAAYMAIPKKYRGTMKQIAEDIGVSDRSLYTWKWNPNINNLSRKIAIQYLGHDLPEALYQLKRRVSEGSEKAIEIMLNVLGIIKKGGDIRVNSPTNNLVVSGEDVRDVLADLRSLDR